MSLYYKLLLIEWYELLHFTSAERNRAHQTDSSSLSREKEGVFRQLDPDRVIRRSSCRSAKWASGGLFIYYMYIINT